MGRSSRDAERWRQAKKRKSLIFTIEAYVPIPRRERTQPEEAKHKIVEALNPAIHKLKQVIQSYDGIVHVHHGK